ncbi:DUF2271 domain-containing protein [Nonomuraea rubra]|uniref:DUF2271 domain-containing protein n=1 Tax=Nonomuraea rubra TaxID=46180 RepID=A0A7X0NZ86_9ACTN|nr:DUF2271 domain-containing protein [Nonomuraea rubra]MBB6552354.1 hypothetical protein [Nonomuraea rubra]
MPVTGRVGLVRIDYQLNRLPRLASNQLAIWIEDARGRCVRTLFATSFTANGGFERRPMSLPLWRQASGWESATDSEVRAAGRPAQESGRQSVYWDTTDRSGKPVPPGSYTYRVEGNVVWEKRVLFTGSIEVGDTPHASLARVEFLPADTGQEPALVADVRAGYSPGQGLPAGAVTTFTRGS